MSKPKDPERVDFRAFAKTLADARGWSLDAPEEGPPTCDACHGPEVRRRGQLCAACEAARLVQERRDAVAAAWGTVPKTLQWASLSHQGLRASVRDGAAVDAVQELAARDPLPKLVAFAGPSRVGKTLLACALLREHVRRGIAPDASPRAVWHARRARFASAMVIQVARDTARFGEHVPEEDVAYQASVLVLDELGRERDHAWAFALLWHRHAEGKPTIITTPLETEEGLAAITDGGFAARVFQEGDLVRVRRVEPPKGSCARLTGGLR